MNCWILVDRGLDCSDEVILFATEYKAKELSSPFLYERFAKLIKCGHREGSQLCRWQLSSKASNFCLYFFTNLDEEISKLFFAAERYKRKEVHEVENNTCHRFWHFVRHSLNLNHKFLLQPGAVEMICCLETDSEQIQTSSFSPLKLRRTPKKQPVSKPKPHLHLILERRSHRETTTEATNVNPIRDQHRKIIALPKIEIIYFLPSLMISHSVLSPFSVKFNRRPRQTQLDTIALSFFNENYVSYRFQFLQFHLNWSSSNPPNSITGDHFVRRDFNDR